MTSLSCIHPWWTKHTHTHLALDAHHLTLTALRAYDLLEGCFPSYPPPCPATGLHAEQDTGDDA